MKGTPQGAAAPFLPRALVRRAGGAGEADGGGNKNRPLLPDGKAVEVSGRAGACGKLSTAQDP